MEASMLSNLVITKIRSVSKMYNPANAKASRRDRQCWAIIMKYEGETFYSSGGKHFLSDSSHLVIIPKGCSYTWECTKSGRFFSIEFESDLTGTEPFTFPVKNSDKILKIFRELEYRRTLKAPLSEIESIKDAYSIILTLLKSEPEKYSPTEKQQKIAPAIEYISHNYDKRITNDELASITGLSTVYFRKLFVELIGVSPIAYARALRIEKAKEILESDYGTLTDIAQCLGYSSLYDFSRDFRKHTGVAPSKY